MWTQVGNFPPIGICLKLSTLQLLYYINIIMNILCIMFHIYQGRFRLFQAHELIPQNEQWNIAGSRYFYLRKSCMDANSFYRLMSEAYKLFFAFFHCCAHFAFFPPFSFIIKLSILSSKYSPVESCLRPCWPSTSWGVLHPYRPSTQLGVYSTTIVQSLYISCYLSDNKPVLSYLSSRLLPHPFLLNYE